MSATVRCAACGQQWNNGTAADRYNRFQNHQCNQLPQIDTAPSIPSGVMVIVALLAALMVFSWLAEWLARADWFTPIALFTVVCVAGVAVFKLTGRNPQ